MSRNLKLMPCCQCGTLEPCDMQAIRWTCGMCVVKGYYKRPRAEQEELAIYDPTREPQTP